MKIQRIPAAIAFATAAVVGFGAFSLPAAAQQKFITIGTGGVTGVYYAAGGAICRLVNTSLNAAFTTERNSSSPRRTKRP